MKLENASYLVDSGGYPFLEIFIDGQPARVHYDQKFLDRDIVYLGSDWIDRLPEIELPEDRKLKAGPITLRGCVKDKRLAGMVRQLRKVADGPVFPTGEIEIPRED